MCKYTMNTCQTRDNGFLSFFSKAIAFCCDCPASGNLKQFGTYQININVKNIQPKTIWKMQKISQVGKITETCNVLPINGWEK